MELKFGTAGIRGVMGPLPGQMNNKTVRLATLGLAAWLKKTRREPLLVLIARDPRIHSAEFAEETARTLQGCGIRALLFEDIVPVPMLSFAVRRLHADAGVMITASHNAKEYNGYKIYAASGCQLLPQDAKAVEEEIRHIPEDAQQPECGSLSYVPRDVQDAYIAALTEASDPPQRGEGSASGPKETGAADPLRVVYTPLNGSGRLFVQQVLQADGIEVFTVPEQEWPDGEFPTCGQPNPEREEVFALAMRHADRLDASLIVATDPDCDRVGAMARRPDGSWRLLSGNDLGVLVLSYLCRTRDLRGKTFISSFVSTPLADRIAEAHGMEVLKTPVGFKHITAGMDSLQERFGFAFEESNGMILGLYTRDKDGVLGARLICQAAEHFRGAGVSVCEALDAVNERFGPVFAKTVDVAVDPSLPKPQMTTRDFEDGSRIVVRPSGTEPKTKYYFFASSSDRLEELRKECGV